MNNKYSEKSIVSSFAEFMCALYMFVAVLLVHIFVLCRKLIYLILSWIRTNPTVFLIIFAGTVSLEGLFFSLGNAKENSRISHLADRNDSIASQLQIENHILRQQLYDSRVRIMQQAKKDSIRQTTVRKYPKAAYIKSTKDTIQ